MRTASFILKIVALGVILISPVSCATELTDDSVVPTLSVSPTATSTALPTPVSSPAPLPPVEPTPVPPEPPPTESAPATHIVQPGDTLLGIAAQYDVPMAAIQLRNGMGDSTVVQVGQVLSIPPRSDWQGASRYWIVHVVETGETLLGIARSYGLSVEQIKAVNGLTDANLVTIGQELVLPLDALAVALAPTPTPTATTVPPPTAMPSPTITSPVASPPTTTPSPAPTAVPAAPPPPDVANWPREVWRLINEVRARHGLPPLAYNETLAQVAQAHATDCLQRGWGSHVGSDGSNVRERMMRAGYDPVRWSECWAHTQSPQMAMEMWMNEAPPNDPHRRTILSTHLTEVGVGVVKPDWGYYFFADFGQPRDGP